MAGMVTHMGRCFTFDAGADGFVRGEGFAALHFKVSDPEDFSRLAMLCGTCMNQDGRSASLTAPHGPSQQECIRHSLREAGIRALDIQIQELHGTGTPLGDPIEVGALRATMMSVHGETRVHPLVKTCSKSHLGHTELCAGGCGMIKCVLMGLYCTAPPNCHIKALNPHIDAAGYPVIFNSEAVDQGKDVGFHGVSSFGFGGSNARGDIWARAQGGHRNTQPGKVACDLTRQRLEFFAEAFGLPCLPGSAELIKSDSRGGAATDIGLSKLLAERALTGHYFTGDPIVEDGRAMFVHGSFNGWSSLERMDWDEDLRLYSFGVALGETRVEQFRIHCGGLGDIFPASEMAGAGTLVLGPGHAPLGHCWAIDGREEQAPEGTVYRISFRWDEGKRQKVVAWMPTDDARSVELAISSVYPHRYFVLGSWTLWKPMEMTPVKGMRFCFETTVRLGLSGVEDFRFQRDRDPAQGIYPARSCRAGGGEHLTGPASWQRGGVPVRGPDCRGQAKCWRIVGDTGEQVKLRLQVEDGDIVVSAAGPREIARWTTDAGLAYFLAGPAGASWELIPMELDGGRPDVYRARLRVSERGSEEFRILVDRDPSQSIYPEMHLADQGLALALGPDGHGSGMYWSCVADFGVQAEVFLDVSRADRRQMVTWRFEAPTGT
mmetsp:Transcript_112127/g.302564  ORF Transcript_112127/g.302564 Transcript_112127/m.302564 type:complete len:662 (+) Transcript_112127:3-1988(+)